VPGRSSTGATIVRQRPPRSPARPPKSPCARSERLPLDVERTARRASRATKASTFVNHLWVIDAHGSPLPATRRGRPQSLPNASTWAVTNLTKHSSPPSQPFAARRPSSLRPPALCSTRMPEFPRQTRFGLAAGWARGENRELHEEQLLSKLRCNVKARVENAGLVGFVLLSRPRLPQAALARSSPNRRPGSSRLLLAAVS